MDMTAQKLLAMLGPDVSGPLGRFITEADRKPLEVVGSSGLFELLRFRNGFFAFGGALHVFPWGKAEGYVDIEAWNDKDLWRFEYKGLDDNALYFAEDVFGGQFGIHDGRVTMMDPETAERLAVAENVSAWLDWVISDPDLSVGRALATQWSRMNGRIPVGQRLVPRIPFVMGGGYELENLVCMNSVSAMRTRGAIAVQIEELPDGSPIRLDIIE